MGYYTYYNITTDKVLPDGFEDKFLKITGYSFDGGEFECKWYDYKKDMIKISKLYPNILFTVEGEVEGDDEGSGDSWRLYFYNGKNYRIKPKIV
jgi:uncharacterized protein YodC (DUF2158 family)